MASPMNASLKRTPVTAVPHSSVSSCWKIGKPVCSLSIKYHKLFYKFYKPNFGSFTVTPHAFFHKVEIIQASQFWRPAPIDPIDPPAMDSSVPASSSRSHPQNDSCHRFLYKQQSVICVQRMCRWRSWCLESWILCLRILTCYFGLEILFSDCSQ